VACVLLRHAMAGSLSRHELTRCYRRGWRFERLGWVAMIAVAVGAAAGVFGNGALSSVEVTAGDALVARYPRYARAEAPLELELEWSSQTGDTVLWVARAYLDEFTVEAVQPAPSGTTFDSERIYYSFRAIRPDDRVRVEFRLRPKHGGRLVGTLGVTAETKVELRQMIFP
jgi:hypothetical protein